MDTINVTTTRGASITLQINGIGTEIMARNGNMEIGVISTDKGFKSRFPVNGRYIEAELVAADLPAMNALFAELTRRVSARAAADAAYDDRVAFIEGKMRSL